MKKSVLIVGIIALVLIVAGIYFAIGNPRTTGNVTSNPSPQLNTQQSNSEVKVINIDAQRFQFSPNAITVKKGDHVRLVINNIDTQHGIVIPDLGVSGIDTVEFTADKAGTFAFHCPTFCGNGHRDMKGTLIVQE